MTKESNNTFDSAAKNYDKSFTFSITGKLQRNRVYHWLNKSGFFKEERRVFEINCGTGYDANEFTKMGHQVIASDGSKKMIEHAKNLYPDIEFIQLDINKLTSSEKFKESDVLFSDFGGLNCLNSVEIKELIHGVSGLQTKKDLIICVLMSKFCFIESSYFIIKFKFNKIFRRLTNKSVSVKINKEYIDTYYYAPRMIKKNLKKGYRILLLKPVALFLPPSYMEQFFSKRKKLLKFLSRLEHIFGRLSFLAAWSDHYIIIAEKK